MPLMRSRNHNYRMEWTLGKCSKNSFSLQMSKQSQGGLGANPWLVVKLRLGSRSLGTHSAALSSLDCR